MNDELWKRYVSDLKLKSYQKRTVQSYMRAVRQLQNFTNKALEEISEEDVREYWLYCKEELGWGSATLRISYSGIKLFYSLTLKRDWEVLRAVKFERDQTVPTVLNLDEVRALLGSVSTLGNRAFFTMMYACGLRQKPSGQQFVRRPALPDMPKRKSGPVGLSATVAAASVQLLHGYLHHSGGPAPAGSRLSGNGVPVQ